VLSRSEECTGDVNLHVGMCKVFTERAAQGALSCVKDAVSSDVDTHHNEPYLCTFDGHVFKCVHYCDAGVTLNGAVSIEYFC
jgi:hypothetical protein